MHFANDIILLSLGATTATYAFSQNDLPLAIAHRFVLHVIDEKSPTTMDFSKTTTRTLTHDATASPKDSCTICYDGSDPYHPNRKLLHIDDVRGSILDASGKEAKPLTCAQYGSAFLSQLFPEDSSCRAFQVRIAAKEFLHVLPTADLETYYEESSDNLSLKHIYTCLLLHREVWLTSAGVPALQHFARCVTLAWHPPSLPV